MVWHRINLTNSNRGNYPSASVDFRIPAARARGYHEGVTGAVKLFHDDGPLGFSF
jgi:hypothetical protein